jgi:hypothetical protein
LQANHLREISDKFAENDPAWDGILTNDSVQCKESIAYLHESKGRDFVIGCLISPHINKQKMASRLPSWGPELTRE